MSNDELDASHPLPTEYDKMGLAEIARIGLEFEYEIRVRELNCIFVGDPPSRFYWIVKLGRMVLQRDGLWAYYASASHAETESDRRQIQMQRFVTFDEAVRVATKVFGKEPEHAAWVRRCWKAEELTRG
jgi:hypothetical protein